MSKNKKSTVFSLLTFLGIPLLVAGFFLNLWAINASGNIYDELRYKIFEKIPTEFMELFPFFDQTYQDIWRILFIATVFLTATALLVYVIFTILEFANVKKVNTNLFKKISSITLIFATLLLLVFGSLFSAINVINYTGTQGSTFISIDPDLAFYAFAGGAAVSGVFGLLSIKPNKKNKKK